MEDQSPFKIVTYRVIRYDKLEKIIFDHFELGEIEILADEEWDNDTEHAYSIAKDDYDGYAKRTINTWLNGGRWPGVRTILIAMANDGNPLIVDGNYLITVSW